MRSTRRTVATTRRVAMRSTSRSRGLASGRGRAQRRPPPLRLLRRHLDRPLGRPLPLPLPLLLPLPLALAWGRHLGPPTQVQFRWDASRPLQPTSPRLTRCAGVCTASEPPPTPCRDGTVSMGRREHGGLSRPVASMAQQRPPHPGVPHGLFASSAADSRCGAGTVPPLPSRHSGRETYPRQGREGCPRAAVPISNPTRPGHRPGSTADGCSSSSVGAQSLRQGSVTAKELD